MDHFRQYNYLAEFTLLLKTYLRAMQVASETKKQ